MSPNRIDSSRVACHRQRTRMTFATAVLALSALLLLVPSIARAADLSNGGKVFEIYCAQCHGSAGQGVIPGAPKFNRGERMLQPDIALMTTIKRGKNAMPAFQGVLRDREILDVIAFLRTLQK